MFVGEKHNFEKCQVEPITVEYAALPNYLHTCNLQIMRHIEGENIKRGEKAGEEEKTMQIEIMCLNDLI